MALAESKEAEVNKEEEQVYDEAADKEGLQAQEDDWAVNEYSVSGERYFYVFGAEGEVEGPYGLSDLTTWFHSGMIGPDTFVCEAETEEWLALSSLIDNEPQDIATEEDTSGNELSEEWYMMSETGETLGPYPVFEPACLVYFRTVSWRAVGGSGRDGRLG